MGIEKRCLSRSSLFLRAGIPCVCGHACTATDTARAERGLGKLAAATYFRGKVNNDRMPHRDLYLAAYDIAQPRRLNGALRLTRAYATGGQKSVHELFLTPAERHVLVEDMSVLLDMETDRFLLLRLDPRSRVFALGKAIAPADPDYFYAG